MKTEKIANESQSLRESGLWFRRSCRRLSPMKNWRRNPFVNQVFGFLLAMNFSNTTSTRKSQSLRESGLWFRRRCRCKSTRGSVAIPS